MCSLGFSSKIPRNFLVIGAILLVVLFLIMLLRKYTNYFEREAKNHNHINDAQRRGKKHEEVFKCCPIGIRTYALEELKLATRDFRIRIGVGATSYVYLAELGDGRFGAVKRIMDDRGGSRKMFLDEVSVLLRISHPNLVGLMGFCLEKGEQLLLLEYVPNKSLFDRLHTYHGQSSGILTWSNRLSIALDVARALDYLHSQADPPIIHRDIKSSNILLIDNDHAKLADFGLCKLGYDKSSPQTSTTIRGSFGYLDTNYLKTGRVSPKCDVYSFGVLLLELITGLKSAQGSVSLAEWTEEWRKNDDIEEWSKMLDPKLYGLVHFEQLKVLIDVSNWALLENSEARPEMNQIVDRILSCIESQSHIQLPV